MSDQNISLFPLWKDARSYTLPTLRQDALAAVNVALLALPQAIAYAFLVGLPPSAGIWSAVFGTLFAAAFGQSRYLLAGPTNTIAILLESGVSDILYTYYPNAVGASQEWMALQIVVAVVFLVGLFQIGAALLRLGRITQFTSRSVVLGYMVGAASAIAVTQVFSFFGVTDAERSMPLYQRAWYFLGHMYTLHWPTALVGICSLGLLIVLYRISKKIPAPALVFALLAVVIALFHLSNPAYKNPNSGAVHTILLLEDVVPALSGLPHFSYPFFEMRILVKLVPLAFAIAFFGALEVTAIGRFYTTAKDPVYNDNQDLYGVGVGNVVSSFFGAMPSSGSFSRTALNVTLNAKTRFAAVLSGVVVFIFATTLHPFVLKIPLASLSALMLLTAWTMVDFKGVTLCLTATRPDAWVVAITGIASWIFTLDVALYIGMGVSIAWYLQRAGILHIVEYAFNNVGKLRPLEEDDKRSDPRICILQTEGDLFFAAADPLQGKVRSLVEREDVNVVILQMFNIRYIDASVCLALKQLMEFMDQSQKHLLLSGISVEVWKVLVNAGLVQMIGLDRCFPANDRIPSDPTRRAYAYAKKLLQNGY